MNAMLPAEHPDSDHRNAIGIQRSATLDSMGRKITELHGQGYHVEVDQMLDEMTILRSVWNDDEV